MKRTLIITVILVAVLLIGSGLTIRWYLQSTRVSQQVTTKLEAMYGGQVQVGEVDIGLKSSSVKDLAFFEEGTTSKGDPPWLKISSLNADVSLWDLLSGSAVPERVLLKGATLLFRFDRDGNLITRFPGQLAKSEATESGETVEMKLESVPDAEIENGEAIFRKEGQPDIVVRQVKASLSTRSGKTVLKGKGNNAELGKLVLSGSLDKDSNLATFHLATESTAHVTQSFLDRVPFVPVSVWEEIQIIEGDTPASLTVNYDLNKKSCHYLVELVPVNTQFFIPAIELSAKNASANILIDEEKTVLRNIHAQASGGSVSGDAEIILGAAISKIRLSKISVENLDLHELPETWNIPAVVRKTVRRGKLFGTASLELTVVPSRLTPLYASTLTALSGFPNGFGSNQWFPTAALLTAFPGYEIRTDSKGKAQVRDPSGLIEPIDFDWQLAPRMSRPGTRAFRSGIRANYRTYLCSRANRSQTGDPIERDQVDWQTALNMHRQSFVSILAPEIMERLLASEVLRNTMLVLVDVKDAAESFEIQLEPGKDAKDAPNYLDMNLNLKNVNLGDFIKNLGMELPFPLDGKMSIQIKASLPLDHPNDLKAYKVKGSVQVHPLVLAGVKLEEVNADILYLQGKLSLQSLQGKIVSPDTVEKTMPGSFHGSGELQLFPLGELRADLSLDHIPLDQAVPLGAEKVQGNFSGKMTMRAPAEKLKTIEGVVAEGKIFSELLQIEGLKLEQVSTTMVLKEGLLKLTDLKMNLEGSPVTASAELNLKGDYSYHGKLYLQDWNLVSLQKLMAVEKTPVIALAGAFTTSLDMHGKLNPFQINLAGDARARDLKVEQFEAKEVKFHWTTDGKKLDFQNVDAMLYGGQAKGSAVLPLDDDSVGKVDLTLHKLNAKQLARDLKAPFLIEGEVDGSLKGIFPPHKEGKTRMASLDLDIKASKMRVQNIPTEQLQGKLDYKQGVLDYKLAGKTLGGSFDLEGQIPSKNKDGELKNNKGAGKKGRLSIRGVKLSRLFQALNATNAESIRGVLNIELPYTHETANGYPEGRGSIRITSFRWKDKLVADTIQGDLFLTQKQFRLRNMEGNLAQGIFDAQVTYYFQQPERSWFTLNFEGVEAAQLFGPWLEEKIEGPLQARIRGTLGSEWRGTADLELARGRVLGLEVTHWRVPVAWSYAPDQQRAQFTVHESSAQLVRGHAVGKINVVLDHAARVEGSLRFDKVNVQNLLAQTIGPSHLGGGLLTGRFDFSGQEMRSLHDLNGVLVASFNQAQPLQIPVLSQVAPYLGAGTTTTYQKGDLHARLNRGVLRIQQLTLMGNNQQIYLDGTISVEGRLNLSVMAKTGDIGLPTLRLGVIGLRIPVAGPVPVVVLQEASNFLSNRLIYLQVTGTVHSPVIQPRPVPLLSQEAVRFFLNKSNLPITLNP